MLSSVCVHISPVLTAVILTRGCSRRGIWVAAGYQNTNTVSVRALSLGVTYSWEKLLKAKETYLELARVMHLRVCRSLSPGLYVRGCLARVLQTSFYLIIKFCGGEKKFKKLCKEESRCILVVVCPDCLPSLEVEVLFFPVSCCCSEIL